MKFDQLPEDVLLHIASFMPTVDTHNPMNMFLVNKRTYKIYEDNKKHIDTIMLSPYYDEYTEKYSLSCPHGKSNGFIKLVCNKEKEFYEKHQEVKFLSNFNIYHYSSLFTGCIFDEDSIYSGLRKELRVMSKVHYNRFIITGNYENIEQLLGLLLAYHKVDALKLIPKDKIPSKWRFNFYFMQFYFNEWYYKENKFNELYVIDFMLTNFKYNKQQIDKLIKFLIKYGKFYSIAFILVKYNKLCDTMNFYIYIDMLEKLRFFNKDEFYKRTINLLN